MKVLIHKNNCANSAKYYAINQRTAARKNKLWLIALVLIANILCLTSISAQAQNNVGIGTTTPNPKAILELQATDKGLLVPRLTLAERNAILVPPNGLLVYNTTENCFNYYNNGTGTWKSMCNVSGISNSGDTVIINLLKADSIFANYLTVNNAFVNNLFAHYITADSAHIKNLISNYIKADSAYIKLLRTDSIFTTYLQAHYIRTDSIYAGLGRFDSLVIKGLSIDSLIKQITSSYLNSKDTVVLKYLRADSIYTHILRADTAFIGYIKANTIQADTIIGGFGSFDSLYVGGKNILQTISDSIDAKAWLTKGNIATTTYKLGTLNARDLHIVANNTEAITVANGTGNVGIGQTLPAAKLDVLGNIQFFGDLKSGGLPGVAGQYLTSAGLGVSPTWTSLSIPATTVSNTLTGTNLTTTVNGVTGAPIDLSTIAPATTVSNTYNTTTGALSTTVNGVTGTNVTLPTANNITDSIKAQAWLLKGNAGTVAGTNFIGTTDNVDVVFKRNGVWAGLINQPLNNTSFGLSAFNSSVTGSSNTAIGGGSLTNITSGQENTGIGAQTLSANNTGNNNTATGMQALNKNTGGNSNTSAGLQSLFNNTTGSNNTANGQMSLKDNIIGNHNTGFGIATLFSTTSSQNTALGSYAGYTNVTGGSNLFVGTNADVTVDGFSKASAIGYNAKVGASNAMVLGGTGADAVKVAIGKTIPAQELDVVGNIQFSKALMPNASAGTSGQLLASAGAGVAPTWINASTLPAPASAWNILGNAGTVAGTNFIGTTDNVDVVFKRNGVQSGLINATLGSTSFGVGALNPLNTGVWNVAFGVSALGQNTTGVNNVAYGSQALGANTIGQSNTAMGERSMQSSVNGNYNASFGFRALLMNSSGTGNTVMGSDALNNNTIGNNNIAIGSNTGVTNTVGASNTFIGTSADAAVNNLTKAVAIGFNAIVGASNSMVLGGTGADAVKVAIGKTIPAQELDVVGNVQFSKALMPNASAGTSGQLLASAGAGVAPTWINASALPAPASAWNILGNAGTVAGTNFIGTTDNQNVVFKRNNVKSGLLAQTTTAFGVGSFLTSTANANTAIGGDALALNTTGTGNTAIGESALYVNSVGNDNTALGYLAGDNTGSNTSGIGNTLLGAYADAQTGNLTNATAIGYKSMVGASNSMVLGGTGVDAVKVAIGKTTPAQELDVVGNVQFSKALMPNASAGTSGQLLASAGAGVAPTWINANTLPAPASAWNILGNAGTVDGTNFIGTTDNVPFNIRVNNQKAGRIDNTNENAYYGFQAGQNSTTATQGVAIGSYALQTNTTGQYNTAVGRYALNANTTGRLNTGLGNGALSYNTIGEFNTAAGYYALFSNTTGVQNTAVGNSSLLNNTVGSGNAAFGCNAGYYIVANANTLIGNRALYGGDNITPANNTANDNVVVGYQAMYGTVGTPSVGARNAIVGNYALYSNTTGNENSVNGYQAMYSNTIGSQNVSNGNRSMYSNSVGTRNTANGAYSLTSNTTGGDNVATGNSSLYNNISGYGNTATGTESMYTHTTGNFNVANGFQSLHSTTSATNNTAIGTSSMYSNVTGTDNVAVGYRSLYTSTGSNNTATGSQSLTANTTGINNVANGFQAMNKNTVGNYNTAIGNNALYNNTADLNTAVGHTALFGNTTGILNTATGAVSLSSNTIGARNSGYGWGTLQANISGNENSAVGHASGSTNTVGNYNTYMGAFADATANNFSKAVAIGYNAKVGASNSMVLGGTGADAVNVGINTATPAASARLDVVSTTSGFAMPRMTSVQRKAIVSPIDGLQVIDTDLKGIYIYFGGKWDCVSVPAGSTGYFANTTAPNGYLECNGQAVNRSIYAELFAAIGTVYGIGDGLSTFNVPDLRGEFVRGIDNARGIDAGRAIGTGQIATQVLIDDDALQVVGAIDATNNNLPLLGYENGNPSSLIAHHYATSIASATGIGPSFFRSVRPRNVAMLPCIKF